MKPSLVVLAAGIGSRYGGIKQLDGFGPNGERIIDYTIFDALKAGYGKIVFVIRKAIESEFRELIIKQWKTKGDLHVVYQEMDSLPEGYVVPEGRTKPWGTAHAVWMAESEIKEPFAIVNADDFYGFESLKSLADHLKTVDPIAEAGSMVGYQVANTLTEFGTVSRGVCESDKHGHLTTIVERTKVARDEKGIYFIEEGIRTDLPEKALVSMNLMGFSPVVFKEIASGFSDLYNQTHQNVNVEYYIPYVLNRLVEKGVKVPVISTPDSWFGVTYPEDKTWVSNQIRVLVESGRYPSNLLA